MYRTPPAASAAVRAVVGAAALLVACSPALAEPSLVGRWECEGSNEGLSYRSSWTVEASGEFTSWAATTIGVDLDADGEEETLELATRDSGRWSLDDDESRLRLEGIVTELVGAIVDERTMPVEIARQLFGEMLALGEAGSVTVEVESLAEDRLVGEADGVRSVCTR